MAANYDDVLSQLRSAGLLVDALLVGRLIRCRTDGSKERRGWYHLHDWRMTDGTDLIVGTFGVWRGNENNAQKIDIRKTELSSEQRASLRKRLAEDMKRAEYMRAAEGARAAKKAQAAWKLCKAEGDCEYLSRKGVAAHGVRFSPSGAMIIPMLDAGNNIHGLQVIRSQSSGRELDKEFWPKGLVMTGHFFLIGLPGPLILITEGYATGASLYEATGLPVAVVFTAANIRPAVLAIKKRYKQTKILLCADDDVTQKCHIEQCKQRVWLLDGPNCLHCNHPHLAKNAGINACSTVAMEVGAEWLAPRFADEASRKSGWLVKAQKLTDFNDLHVLEGLHVVREQVQAKLTALGWHVGAKKSPNYPAQGAGGEGQAPLKPIETVDELLERFALVYGQGGTVFDHQEHCLLALSDMRDACIRREIHRAWAEHPDRSLVRVAEVGFDPACTDKTVSCNLWAGWPTTPKKGNCEYLLDLLLYMCGADSRPDDLYRWVLKWLAYPIQHPGAKMKTTLVIHGPQGTGKNMFFEAIMAIYGKYGRVIDQSAIEDKFNDWASRKLFLIADEVVARSDLYHVKNKLKAFITGEWIRINPKNMAAYEERNHVNMVFLSNEAMPVVLERDDRRHVVIWTPEKLSRDFYQGVQREINNGGVEALHDYLLNLDLGDFEASTLPPMTEAKRELIDLSMDSPSRFLIAMEEGEVEGFPGKTTPMMLSPCLSQDLFEVYQEWCRRVALKSLSMPRFLNAIKRHHGAKFERKRYAVDHGVKGPSSVCFLAGGHDQPLGRTEADWLGERIEVFKTGVKDYKGMAFGGLK